MCTTTAAGSALDRRGLERADLTCCLQQVENGKRFIEGRPHYSADGNRAVATCLTTRLAGYRR